MGKSKIKCLSKIAVTSSLHIKNPKEREREGERDMALPIYYKET
jgi:hypothetical protein